MAAEKLEDQLLKLKEQREILKGQGHKHEDNIMKENAKLQVNDSLLLSRKVLTLIMFLERGQVQDLLHEGVHGENRQRPGG